MTMTKKLTNQELELIQNAMLFYNEAEQIEDENEDKVFHSAYQKLGEMYDEETKRKEVKKYGEMSTMQNTN